MCGRRARTTDCRRSCSAEKGSGLFAAGAHQQTRSSQRRRRATSASIVLRRNPENSASVIWHKELASTSSPVSTSIACLTFCLGIRQAAMRAPPMRIVTQWTTRVLPNCGLHTRHMITPRLYSLCVMVLRACQDLGLLPKPLAVLVVVSPWSKDLGRWCSPFFKIDAICLMSNKSRNGAEYVRPRGFQATRMMLQ